MTQSLKAIFFDMDGTLVNTEHVFFQVTQDVFKEFGVELTSDYYIHKSLAENISTFALLRQHDFSEEELVKIRAKRDVAYTKKLKEGIEIFDGVLDLIPKLAKKYTLAIVTSSYRENFEVIMDHLGLHKYFDFIIVAEDNIDQYKPHPAPYLLAHSKVSFDKEECLVIEDTQRGVTSAKEAGLVCYAVPNEMSQLNDFSRADKVLGDIEELKGLL